MGGDRPVYGKDYIIPSTFDPRLISRIPAAVAQAAMESGVARKKILDIDNYKDQLTNRLDPSMSIMQGINAQVKKDPRQLFLQREKTKICLKQQLPIKIVDWEPQL